MHDQGFISDGEAIADDYRASFDTTRLKLIAGAVRAAVKNRDRKSQNELVREYAKALGIDFKEPKSGAITEHTKQWASKGDYLDQLPVYFAWLSGEHPSIAKTLYADLGLKFRPWAGPRPAPRMTDLEIMSLAGSKQFRIDAGWVLAAGRRLLREQIDFGWVRRFSIGALVIVILTGLAGIYILDSRDQGRANTLRSASTSEAIQEYAELSPSTQVEVLEQRLRQPITAEEEAVISSQLSVLNVMLGRPQALAQAERAVTLNPRSINQLMRLAAIQASLGKEEEFEGTIARIEALDRLSDEAERFLGISWVFRRTNWPELAATVGDPENLWLDISGIRDDQTREIVMITTSIKYAVFGEDFSILKNYLSYSEECAVLRNAAFKYSCNALQARLAIAEERDDDAIKILEDASADAWDRREIRFGVGLDVERAHVVSDATADGFTEAISIVEAVLDDARALGDKPLLFNALRSLFGFYRDWPSFDIRGALPYGREAFALGGHDPTNPLFSYSNFLEHYAVMEAEIGDPAVAVAILPHLIEIAPQDSVFEKAALALLVKQYAFVLRQTGDEQASLRQVERAAELANQAVDAIPPATPITADAHPRSRDVERYRVGILNMYVNSGMYGIVDRIYGDQLRELEALPPDLREQYADYERQTHLNRAENVFDAYVGDRNAVSDAGAYVADTDRLIRDTRQACSAGRFEDSTCRSLDNFELQYAYALKSDEEYMTALAGAWDRRLAVVLAATGMTEGQLYDLIPDAATLASTDIEQVKAAWFEAIEGIERPGNFPWLIEFADQNSWRAGFLPDDQDLEVAAYLTLVYPDVGLQLTPGSGGDERIRARYESAATMYQVLAERAFNRRDEITKRAYLVVSSRLADAWLSGVERSRDLNTRQHYEMLLISIIGMISRGEYTTTMQAAEQYEDIKEAVAGSCDDCQRIKELIVDGQRANLTNP